MLKRVVIKEELVALTGDFKRAVVLNQMIYWSERVRDFDKFIAEEKERAASHQIEAGNKELTNGWIYKKAEELSQETMLGFSKNTIGRILEHLVEKKWLDRRRNPRYNYDKTYQYRVNILKIQKDLLAIGYHLEGHKVSLECQNDTRESSGDTSSVKMGLEVSKWDSECQNDTAIPEITSEITSEITKTTTTTESENRVVVVQEKYESLFEKKLTKKQAEDLIILADKNAVDVIHKIENTYEMHRVEPRRTIIGSIKTAIENGDWEIPTAEKKPSTLPKSMQQKEEIGKIMDIDLAHQEAIEFDEQKERITEKLNILYANRERIALENGAVLPRG